MRTPEELADLFRSRGLKMTPQRESIFRVLHGNQAHPSAESVYTETRQQMPMLSLKTVYQTLNDLADMGEIRQLDLGTGSSRFDPNVEHRHHHLVCTECGKVRDFYAPIDISIPAAEQQGFAIGTTEVIFRGLCADCGPEAA
jgi:Fe2+ or Zn2+ uptake regulation protein